MQLQYMATTKERKLNLVQEPSKISPNFGSMIYDSILQTLNFCQLSRYSTIFKNIIFLNEKLSCTNPIDIKMVLSAITKQFI